jgi:hypothetical protein
MVNQIRVTGGVLLGALVSGALAAGALGGAPTAKADCVSFFGIGNSANCTSTLTSVAIAIGTNAKAYATGLFGSAFALGTDAYANSTGALDVAWAVGPASRAATIGNLSTAIAIGATGGAFNSAASAGTSSADFANVALTLGNDSSAAVNTGVAGFGSLALNLGQGGQVIIKGSLNSAISVGGNQPYPNNKVLATGVLNSAFNLGGNGNTVTAGPGPLAIAGSILQTNSPITKVGPGFNINGLVVGGAAAVGSHKTAAPTATAVHTGARTAAPAASGRGSIKR